MPNIINVAELSAYGEEDEVILEDLDFSVDRGEFVQLSGLSRVQYETLFRILTGDIEPDSGQVVLADRNIVRLSRKKRKKMLREDVSFLPRNFLVPEQKTVLETLEFKLKLAGSFSDGRERLEEVLNLTDLRGEEGVYPRQGGELTRVKTGLALSILTKPDLLVCHEGLSSLNSTESKCVIEILSGINEGTGLSVLLLTDELKSESEKIKLIESNLDSRVVG